MCFFRLALSSLAGLSLLLTVGCGQSSSPQTEQRSFDEMLTSKAVCESACENLSTVCGATSAQCNTNCFELSSAQQGCLADAGSCESARACTSQHASSVAASFPNS